MKKPRESNGAARDAALLDVQLLDVFAQLEALLRQGRQVQRESLRIRDIPDPISEPQRTAATTKISELLSDMKAEHRELGTVMRGLSESAEKLERTQRQHERVASQSAEDRSHARRRPRK
jgi:hypothetical protein